ncbi:MAG: penicillin-binding protein 2 [Flavobacteriales bacterium]
MTGRKYLVIALIILTGSVFIIRLFFLQVVQEKWSLKAANITERRIPIYPSRGLIYGRDSNLLVANKAVYDLRVVPRKVGDIDTAEFCDLIGISREAFKSKMQEARKRSPFTASTFEKQIPAKDYARIAQNLYKFPGFFGVSRTLRSYPDSIAPHVLGYVSEVGPKTLDTSDYYEKGDYIGASGIEASYEKYLRGRKGVRYVVVDVHNNEKGPYQGGKYDTLAKPAKDLLSTIDAELQAYGERLMQHKEGSIVAIEPSSGEVLSMISSPGYNPNLLVGRVRSKNYSRLKQDSLKPLFNRALRSVYPPGSIFKIVQALVGQEMGVLTPQTTYYCDGSVIKDHVSPGYYNLFAGIKRSSNMYFYRAFQNMVQQGKKEDPFKDARAGLKEWKRMVKAFGFGEELPLDIGSQKGGNVPGPTYYDQVYGKYRWNFQTIYSLSIGQGELGITPIQMANFASTVANRGFYYPPHLVKGIEGEGNRIPQKFRKPRSVGVDRSCFKTSVNAMQAVVEEAGGTAWRAKDDSLTICGKTGTVQNPHGEDHSAFIAFSPKKDPRIAIAVYVENAGYGGSWAAPISRLMIEKHLRDTITDKKAEKRILQKKIVGKESDQEVESDG